MLASCLATVVTITCGLCAAADVNSTSVRGSWTSHNQSAPHLPGDEDVLNSIVQLEASTGMPAEMKRAQQELIEASVDGNSSRSNATNETLSASWWGGRGIFGETCCMCSVQNGWSTLLYSAEDYHHFFGGHDAKWRCLHDCPRRCESDWHHGRYFGCYDEEHLREMDRMYGHRSGYQLYYGHFGDLC